MSKDKTPRAGQGSWAGKTDRDAASKAVLDNMARLKALRLAREAAEPPPPPASAAKKPTSKKKAGEKGPALGTWLASQQDGGRRT